MIYRTVNAEALRAWIVLSYDMNSATDNFPHIVAGLGYFIIDETMSFLVCSSAVVKFRELK